MKNKLIVGIDACNIRNGGGLQHLQQILENCDFDEFSIEKIIVWSNNNTLESIKSDPKIKKQNHSLLNSHFFYAFFFQIFLLKRQIIKENCDIILVPGGIFINNFRPYVVVSQNMLPFNLNEAFRYKRLSQKLRFILIRVLQIYTFKRANGVIFLSDYAKRTIVNLISLKTNSVIIPHGYNKSLNTEKAINKSNTAFKLLYLSNLAPYKHQWNVAEAVCLLYQEGVDLMLTLVGSYDKNSLKKLNTVLSRYSCSSNCINYVGSVPHSKTSEFYHDSHAFIFASTCENNPIILTEAISAGLPILCSDYPPMNELSIGDEFLFFDPLNIFSIKKTILYAYENRLNLFKRTAAEKSIDFPKWKDTSKETFKFIKLSYNKFINE